MHPWGSFPKAPRSFPARLPRSFPEAFQKLPQGLSITLGLAPPKALWKLPSRFQNLPDVWGTFQKLLLSFQEAPKGFPRLPDAPVGYLKPSTTSPEAFRIFQTLPPRFPTYSQELPEASKNFGHFPQACNFGSGKLLAAYGPVFFHLAASSLRARAASDLLFEDF